jgi:D-cysteine desulfhydrase
VRPVVALVRDAEERGARRIVTFGAAGSHHVLTMTLFARARGLACRAVLAPQPRSEHAVDTLRAALGAGLEAFPAWPSVMAPWAFARAYGVGDAIVPPGGLGVRGASAYADAVGELVTQCEELGVPLPDCIVVPLGTGATAAGLLAGVTLRGLETTVVAVAVVGNPLARVLVTSMARGVLARRGGEPSALRSESLRIERGFVGDGYGAPTRAGKVAVERAAAAGIELDPTYTAKTLACVLELVESTRTQRRARPLRIVYWHTLSAAPLAPLLAGAPRFDELPRALQRLFR